MRILVIGGAVSGAAAARLARRRGDQVTVYDRDPAVTPVFLSEGIGTMTGEWNVELLTGVDVVVTSPGVPEKSLPLTHAHEFGVPVWSEIEYASRSMTAPMAAITGTNGKTTVTSLVADMLQASGRRATAAGNIGTALSDVADGAWEALAVEVSSFQLRFIDTFHPAVAVILNIADDHLDWHGSAEAYADAKARIFERQTADDALVYDVDDPGARRVAERAPSTRLAVSGVAAPDGGFGVRSGALVTTSVSVPIGELAVDDPAYLVDLAAAGLAAERLGATPDAVAGIARSFRPGRHRRTVVFESDGVVWVNDSKATNPHAAVAAARAYRSVILIAGGRNKGLDLTPVARVPSVRHLIVLGEAAEELSAAAISPVTRVDSLEEAVDVAGSVAGAGDTILLAPGCASFDMFTSYEARGEAFTNAVLERSRS